MSFEPAPPEADPAPVEGAGAREESGTGVEGDPRDAGRHDADASDGPTRDLRRDTGEDRPTPAAPGVTAPGVTAPGAAPRAWSRARVTTIVAAVLVAVMAGSALFVSGWAIGRQAALTPGTPAGEADAFQPFWDAYRAVSERYAGGAVDRKALIQGAIKGMIAALGDPYSMYLTSAEYKASLQGISGELEGIGATIGTVDARGQNASCTPLGSTCRLAVIGTYGGSPAEKAGLHPGDVIDRVDGDVLDGLTVDAALAKIRGPRDTAVRLTIVRAGGAPFDVRVVRAIIVVPEVEAKDLANGTVGYIKLSGFSDHSAADLDRVAARDVGNGRTRLILDLRGNRGGYVTAARDVASQFLADGTVFWEEDAGGSLTEVRAQAGGAAADPRIRLVVLVDGESASASEIVAAALHDNGRATLVGSKTFGKGTVQQWTQLEGDNGGFRLTIAKWLTPAKAWIHGTGITPDVVVTASPSKPGDDPALDAALRALGVSGPAAG
jgi:carboxyl-terminal processing protease